MKKIDRMILELLDEKPMTAYEISKRLNCSWGTAMNHCLKLERMGLISGKKKHHGFQEKVVWEKIKEV